MQFDLVPHPSTPPSNPALRLWANADLSAAFGASATLNIWFGIIAPADKFIIPASDSPARRDELWKATCFEAFLREAGDDSYREWNFAPSGDWAAYDFTDTREGMSEADVTPPYIRMEDNLTWWTLGATIAVPAGQPIELGLSAVIEEADGTRSYWALAHPPGDRPNFHHRDCFAARLP